MDEEEEKGMVKNVLDDILGATENQDQEAKDMKSTEITPSTVEDKNVDPLSRKAMSAKAHDADAVKRINARVDKLTSGFEKANNKDDQKKSELVDPQAVVFIRGLPLDVTRQELYASMQAFGPVASARLVLNKVTGKLKGTAFVDFRTAEGASSAVEACAQWRAKKGSGVVIKGRNVEVDPALDGQGAREISMKKVMTDAKEQDRRNIYLSQEGIIEEGMPAWERLSMSDRNKRRRAREEMKTKLKSPNFSVSKTRLNIRNVPRQWVESQLKQLCIKAVKERAKLAQPKIVQVKILRESEESSRGEEKGRSKGIAFVEFVSHEHALCALRQLNNNPKVWGEEHRPIVEFAVDDVRALKKREAKRKHALALRDGIAGASQGSKEEAKKENGHSEKGHSGKKKKEFAQDKDGDGLNKPEEPKSKRKLRQERRRMLKQRQRAAQGKKPPTVDASAQGLADDQVKKKSQRRRELRKRKMGGSESGNSVSKAKAKTSVDVGIDIALASGSVDGRAVKKRRVGRKIKDKDRLDELAEVYLARQYK
jgi:nucleolar protein 4